jgi:thioester reductase-like protein
VYRIDVICGDRQSGACQTQDFVWLALKGLIQSGAVPEGLGGTVHPVPADHVSASVCALSLREENAGRTFHFHNTDHFDFGELADQLRELGHRLDTLPWERWSARVRADRDNAVLPLFDAFELVVADSDSFYPRIDTAATERALAGLGLRTPPLTKELFTTYVRFFREVGYLPLPDTGHSAPGRAPHSAVHTTRPSTSD